MMIASMKDRPARIGVLRMYSWDVAGKLLFFMRWVFASTCGMRGRLKGAVVGTLHV